MVLYCINLNPVAANPYIRLRRRIQARSEEAILQELAIQYRLWKAKAMKVQEETISDLDLT